MKLEQGEKVKIHEGKSHNFLGIGEFEKYNGAMPSFILDGKIIEGCECWWIRLSEAEKVEKEIK